MNSTMRRVGWFSAGACALLLSSAALAKDDAKKKKDAASEPKGGMMEEGGKDPAETEAADEDGQFVPGKKKKAAPKETAAEGEEGSIDEEGETPEERALAHGKKPEKEEEKPKPKKPPRARKTLGVFGEMLIGFGEAPLPGPANPTTGKATSFDFLVGGHYDLTPAFRLMLRLPWTTGTLPDVNGKDASSNALGTPEMAARYRITEPGDTEFAVKLAVGIPAAQGNPDITDTSDAGKVAQGKLQRVADAANGWHDPELYAPKRLPVTPSATLSHHADEFRVAGEFKATFMPEVGGSPIKSPKPSSATDGSYEKKATALSFLLGGSASYEFMERKFLALAAWATYHVAEPIEWSSSATAPTRFQFVLEPRLLAQFGHFVPMVGFIIPVGGQLQHINGVRLHVDAVF